MHRLRWLLQRFQRRACSSKVRMTYPGATSAPITTSMAFDRPEDHPIQPMYRVIDEDGKQLLPNHRISLPIDEITRMYRIMVELNIMDHLFYDGQRQGRMSFYMTNHGEEAEQIGCSAALDPGDTIFGQYREAGVLMYRGLTVESMADQCFSNHLGHGKGRQMPVHYGSSRLNIQTISSPLATQIPQAVGAAYALKRTNKTVPSENQKEKNCVIVFFGDGAASEGDFHPAMNFAATLECPVIFFCRNNGIAISTPTREQYRGDGIVGRGARGYGMDSIRVDGNDLFAVHEVTVAARERCLSGNGRPVLIEAMTYRGGHHSTSDDSTRYRPEEEILQWRELNNPITRVRMWLEERGHWDAEKETAVRVEGRRKVLKAISRAEQELKPPIGDLFTDVYDALPPRLEEQQHELFEHLKKYPDKYGLEIFSKTK